MDHNPSIFEIKIALCQALGAILLRCFHYQRVFCKNLRLSTWGEFYLKEGENKIWMVCENNKIFHLHKFIISIDRNEHVLNGRLNFLNDQK